VVVLKHALRNALTPVITLGALELGTLLSGAVLTEQVFTIPGFGKLIVDSVFNRDYAVVQGVVMITATAYILLSLLADLAYFLANPAAVVNGGRVERPLATRAWRRLRQRRPAMVGLAIVVLFVLMAVFAPGSARTTPSPPAGARSARRPPPRTGSAPTTSAATCCRAWSGARARRCWPAWCRSASRCWWACPSGCWRASWAVRSTA
jgi:ABC-type dipeptide/oligopeptide/nickel transport system permease subunit